jgi:rhodanese-related sulfurtransferase
VIVDIAEAKEIIADPAGAALVSVRTWREHIGQVSGYNYIGPAGRIKGDVWGNCGSDAYHMQHYRNVDNTMREYPEITANWAEAGITADKWVAFYCGTGWRASETWFYAYLQGWERIAVYDGGWFEWSADPRTTRSRSGCPPMADRRRREPTRIRSRSRRRRSHRPSTGPSRKTVDTSWRSRVTRADPSGRIVFEVLEGATNI